MRYALPLGTAALTLYVAVCAALPTLHTLRAMAAALRAATGS